MLLMIAVASVRLNVVHLFSVFYCSSASAPKSQGVGMTNLPLGGNKLKVVVFFYNTGKSMKNYKILLALRSLYSQFASNNTLTVGCMREYS